MLSEPLQGVSPLFMRIVIQVAKPKKSIKENNLNSFILFVSLEPDQF
jgi:hypothetical protein